MGVAAMFAVVFLGAPLQAIGIVALILGLTAGVVLIVTSIRIRVRKDHLLDQGSAFTEIVDEFDASHSAFRLPVKDDRDWRFLLERCRSAQVNLPRTIVDAGVQSRLAAIPLPDDLLEPETILPSSASLREAVWALFGLYILLGLIQVLERRWFTAVLYVVFGGLLLISLPPVRDRLRTLLDTGNLVAGTGWIRHRGKRTWTVDNAVMLVRTRSGSVPLHVMLIGEEGELPLSFTNERDPDFIKLWQRWNHPHPRPELVVE